MSSTQALALFASDVHLQAAMPNTLAAFLAFLEGPARTAPQLYLLGDLFEYWAGDDDLDDPLNREVAAALAQLAQEGHEIFWIGGNRDFLIGPAFAARAGMTLLDDPTVVRIGKQDIVLTHGDAQCTDDHDYMAFRAMVRNAAWQQAFLARPLAERKQIIAGMRVQSQAAQRNKSYEIMDVNQDAIAALFAATQTRVMIHGHTHRPACHVTPAADGARRRYVLPDWDLDGPGPARGGWIAIDAGGHISRHGLDGAVIP